MATRYKKYLQLVQKWPVDALRPSRDFGALLKSNILEAFKQGEMTKIEDTQKCDKIYKSLEELLQNKHKNDYPYDSSLLGMTKRPIDQLRYMTCDQTIDFIDKNPKLIRKAIASGKFDVD